jgi:hypothetical protein
MGGSYVQAAHVAQAKGFIETTAVCESLSTEVGGPHVSQSRVNLPKKNKQKQKHVYSKWASKRSDHKVVLKLSPKSPTIPKPPSTVLVPKVQPNDKSETPALPKPVEHCANEMKGSIEQDGSEVMQDVEDQNKVFK